MVGKYKVLIILFGSLSIFLIYPKRIFSQFESLGAQQNGLGGSSVTSFNVWSVHNNPGAVAFVDTSEVVIGYENRYFIKELGYQSIAGVFTTKSGNLGFTYLHSGIGLINQNFFGATYSLKLDKKFSLGLQLNYFYYQNPKPYKSYQAFSTALGLFFRPLPKISFGFYIFNPVLSEFSENYTIPVIMKLGVGYKVNKTLFAQVEVVKELQFPFTIKGGIGYELFSHFSVFAGLNTSYLTPSFGFGYHYKKMTVNFGSRFHNILGLVTTADLSLKL